MLCRFWFDPPHLLKSSLQLCIDVYQALLDEVDKQGNDLALFFNLAAWLMLHMVSPHAVLLLSHAEQLLLLQGGCCSGLSYMLLPCALCSAYCCQLTFTWPSHR